MATCYMLIGLPASGKSTWREKHLAAATATTTVISSDDAVEAVARELGVTYSEAMRVVDRKAIDQRIKADFRSAVVRGDDIIVDRTNMSFRARNKFLSQLTRQYTRVAVLFEVPTEELNRRLLERAALTGKHIPAGVIADQLASYVEPVRGEFNQIIRIN